MTVPMTVLRQTKKNSVPQAAPERLTSHRNVLKSHLHIVSDIVEQEMSCTLYSRLTLPETAPHCRAQAVGSR